MKASIAKTILFLTVMVAGIAVHSPASHGQGCIYVGDDLGMTICAEYQSNQYEFRLVFVPDSSGLFWKMDPSTLRQIPWGSGTCNYIPGGLDIRICCARYQDFHCAFTLRYVPYPQDPSGDYWQMDMSTFVATPVGMEDPLHAFQWHLCNAGQTTFSRGAGKPGEDLRMSQAMVHQLTGQGVIVAVLDSGLEIAHEDISGNILPNGSYNFLNHTTDPTPTGTKGDHGTSVAGIIAAMSMNGKGGRGVAPRASLKGFNVLEAMSLQNFVESMGGHPRSQDVDIFNMSYGDEGKSYVPLPPTAKDFYEMTHGLRAGKGAIYVKSAGNEFNRMKINGATYACTDEAYGRPDLTCWNAVAEEENSRPEVITVGAFHAGGVKSSYSTAGSNLWISAPGGEYGTDSPAILTIDLSGCDKGYSRRDLEDPSNPFELGDPIHNPNCNYTSAFNGTSSAAPNASGAIALLLQMNPNLTRRDVKHIVAKTARQIDPLSATSIVYVDINGVNYLASEGWITNAAGYHFHNWYGFGAVNVDAAVAMARTYQAGSLPALVDRTYDSALAQPLLIPDNQADGVIQTIQVQEDLTIENLFVRVAIDHPNTAETGIEIISPQGTRSILLNIRSSVQRGLNEPEGVLLASNAFYNEKARGTWTLKVLDSWPGNTGTLKKFTLRILGY